VFKVKEKKRIDGMPSSNGALYVLPPVSLQIGMGQSG